MEKVCRAIEPIPSEPEALYGVNGFSGFSIDNHDCVWVLRQLKANALVPVGQLKTTISGMLLQPRPCVGPLYSILIHDGDPGLGGGPLGRGERRVHQGVTGVVGEWI